MTLGVVAFRWMLACLGLAILPHALVAPIASLALPIGVIALRAVTFPRWPSPWPLVARALLVLAMLASVWFVHGTLLGRAPGSAMLLGMLALKATEAASPRDARISTVVAMFLLVVALLGSSSPLLAAYIAAASLPMLAALEVYSRPSDAQAEGGLSLVRLMRLTAGLLLAALPFALVLWLLFPRWASPLWAMPEQRLARTGMSEQMEPGSVSQLFLDDTPVFRVRFPGSDLPRGNDSYFRSTVLWYYDGRVWTRALGRSPSETIAFPDRARRLPPRWVDYEVQMLPSEQRFLPVLESPGEVLAELPTRITPDRQYLFRDPLSRLTRYRGRANLSGESDEGLRPYFRQVALSVPRGLNPRTLALGAELRAAHPDVEALVQAVLQRFREESYYYSLEPPPLGRHAMDEFLFDYRSGFCEHYASAFVMLMRGAGVPARVVLGFQGGISVGDYLLVRRADAHAWAEVWHPGRGWWRIDPTAAIDPNRVDERARGFDQVRDFEEVAALGPLAAWIERLNDAWNRSILGFNHLHQQRLLQPFGIPQAGWRDLLAALGMGLVATALLVALVIWLRQRPRRTALAAAYDLYRRRLQRVGVDSEDSEAPGVVFARAAERLGHDPEREALERDWQTLAYAARRADEREAQVLQRRMRRLVLRRRGIAPAGT